MGAWLGTWLILAGAAHAAGWMWLTLPDGGRALAEVMATPEERGKGLMFRAALAPDRLMLFQYAEDGVHKLWMRDCRFAIDAAWLDADGRVLAVARDLPPCPPSGPCPLHGPERPSRHFVEGAAGWVDRTGVRPGARLTFGPRTAGPP